MRGDEAGVPTARSAGLLVVSVEQAVAAPFATMPASGRGRARHQGGAGGGRLRPLLRPPRGRRMRLVRLAQPGQGIHRPRHQGRERQRPAAAQSSPRADVFVQNLAPGAAARAGFDSDELRRRHPRLITCDISGYGESGPYAAMKAYDFLIQCESGIASVTGTPESASRVGVSVCDIGAGLNAYGAILEAVIGRARTGQGTGIRVSLFDGMADWMTVPLLHLEHGGKAAGAHGAQPRHDRALRRLSRGLRWADGDRDPERARVGTLLRAHPGRCGAQPPMSASPATRPGSRTSRRWTRWSSRSSAKPRHGLARGRPARRGHRLRPPQRCRGLVRAPAAPPRNRWRPPPARSRSSHPPARHADGADTARPLRPVPALGEQSEAIRGEFKAGDDR